MNLKHSLVQLAGAALHIGHPRSFNLVQNMNTVLMSAARVPGPLFKLQHQLGFSERYLQILNHVEVK